MLTIFLFTKSYEITHLESNIYGICVWTENNHLSLEIDDLVNLENLGFPFKDVLF